MASHSSSSVCIIGGGMSGILAAQHATHNFQSFKLLERQPCLGGVWQWEQSEEPLMPVLNQDRNLNFSTAMYRDLTANLPKELMQLRDRPWPEGTPSFPHRQQVLEYIMALARDAELLEGGRHEQSVSLNSEVLSVSKLQNGSDRGWNVAWKNVNSGHCSNQDFDVVIVASGHYHKTIEPTGLRSLLLTANPRIRVMHSKEYDNPEELRNKTVLMVGGNAMSAGDIIGPICRVAKRVGVYCRALSTEVAAWNPLCKDLRQRAEDGVCDLYDTPPQDLSCFDVAIFCTGYEFDFNFLPSSLQSTERGGAVNDLYLRILHIEFPSSLVLLGTPTASVIFPLFELQVEAAMAFLSGRAVPPPKEEMLRQADEIVSKAKSTDPNKTTKLFLRWKEYWDELLAVLQAEDPERHRQDEARGRLMFDIFKHIFQLPTQRHKFWAEAQKELSYAVDWDAMTWTAARHPDARDTN